MIEREELEVTEPLEGIRADLALKLFDIGAVEFGLYPLKLHEQFPDAPWSPIYFNLRDLPEDVLDSIGKVLASISSERNPDFCTGLPNAGIPIAKNYARHAGIPYIDIFEKQQTDRGRRIVVKKGVSEKGNLRILDDAISRADTKFEAIGGALDSGFYVSDILVLIGREMGGREQLEKAGIHIDEAMILSKMIDLYTAVGRIDDGFRTHTLIGMQGLREYFSNFDNLGG